MGYNATQPRARSPNQAVGTPRELIDAIVRRFGPIDIDLAANEENHVCDLWFGPGGLSEDSLKGSWLPYGINWLNPPFDDITPWAKKCAEWTLSSDPGALILLLVPGSIDSNWWNESVRGKARVLSLAPRVKFVGHIDPYPKAMTLNVYDPRFPIQPAGDEYYRWKP